jgi:SAM-dependent methyltransferase
MRMQAIDTAHPNATAYDVVTYPSAIFVQTHPDRLGAIAHLHGIPAADPATARVLEVACGDGLNLTAMAMAAPRATFRGFDLARTSIERGRSRIAAAGLRNIELEARDIVEAARGLEGQFDYIIAHGLYAWVPKEVREALFALNGRVLAPAGIAFVSYNTLPGGYFRMAVRDLMRSFIPADADPADALRTARDVLRPFVDPQSGDGPDFVAYRKEAERILNRSDGLLFHDELAGEFHPQLHSDVCAAAERAGLVFLADAGRRRFDDGFLPEGIESEADEQAQIVRLAQQRDGVELRYFRHSLFVRGETKPRRTFDPAGARGLWASARFVREGDGWRGEEGGEFAVKGDPALEGALERLLEARPARLPVADLGLDEDRLRSLMSLFDLRYIQLHNAPAPFATSLPERPEVSVLARTLLNEGLDGVCSLDQIRVRIDDVPTRRFLAELDGSFDAEGMQELAAECGMADPTRWRRVLDTALSSALIVPPER